MEREREREREREEHGLQTKIFYINSNSIILKADEKLDSS